MLRKAFLVCALVLAGCSDDGGDSSVVVTDSAVDSEMPKDTAIADSGAVDTGTPIDSSVVDSGVVDSGAVMDAPIDEGITWDTAGACHGFGFGAPAATITKVASLPTMTGGTIVEGIYDAVAAQTTGTLTGSYRATWSFVSGNKIEAIEQTTLSSPGAIVPRVLTWSTSGTTLTRTQICGGSSTFNNEYTVRSESGATYLDVRSDTLMFTFKKR